jgi:hypothetical protein
MDRREPYLFRSYDHPYPNPALPANELNLHLNAGPAQDVALWKAGRATSAAPGWFPSIKIGGRWYQDGAVAKHNNPIDAAFNEVKQMLPSQDPSVIISIGTGVKPEKQGAHSDPREAPSRWSWYKDTIAQYKRSLGNSVEVHQRFATRLDREYRHSRTRKPKYFRWDVPGGFPTVEFGDWKGLDGIETRDALRFPTESYCKDQVQKEIQECARTLVEIRRRRAKTARWESFALNSRLYYVCPSSIGHEAENAEVNEVNSLGDARGSDEANALDEANVPNETSPRDEAKRDNTDCKALRFDSRISLRQHAIDNHGFVEGPASDEKSDFSHPLRGVHGHQNPRVHIDDRKFKEWLDSGRVVEPPGDVSISQQGTFQRMATWESRLG